MKGINKGLERWLNALSKPVTKENTFIPRAGISDEDRRQHFGNFNSGLMNEIRRVKLLNDGK